MREKEALRELMLSKRKAMNQQTSSYLSTIITANLLPLKILGHTQTFFIYLSIGKEVDTQQIIDKLWQRTKTVTVPKIVDDQIVPIEINDLEGLVKNRGIWEPNHATVFGSRIEVAIIPGLAFTALGHRLGRGAGHYDRFLAQHPQIIKIALAYDWQIVDNLPVEEHDQTMDWIITETKVIRISHKYTDGHRSHESR